MKLPAVANSRQKLRFGAVGALNTVIDFCVYSLLSYAVGLPAIIANFISTSVGFTGSFLLNRRFTFDSHNERKLHEFGRFLATTLIGLWLLQPAVIYYAKALLSIFSISGIWLVVMPKLFAILVGLVWNYIWYSRYVFTPQRPTLRQLTDQLRSRTASFTRSDFGIALVVTLLWQGVMTFVGDLIQYTLTPLFSKSAGAMIGAGLLQHTGGWDGGWFQRIATNLYHGSAAAPAFYPLFPFTTRTVQTLLLNHASLLVAGFLLNTVCIWLGLTALIKIARFFYRDDLPYVTWTVVLLLAMPAAFFLHQFYSEAIFIAFGFWAYYFALTKRWRWAAVCLLFLTATRITAILFVALVGLEFWRTHKWDIKKALLDKQLLWFGLAPAGFLFYGVYLKVVRGDFLAMFHAYHATNDWVYEQFNPNVFHILAHASKASARCVATHFAQCDITGDFVNLMLPLALLLILGALSIIAIVWLRGLYIPLGIMGLTTCLMLTLNDNLVSVHRYLLPVLPIYIIAVEILRRLRWPPWLLFPVVQLGLILQMLLFVLFINGYFAG